LPYTKDYSLVSIAVAGIPNGALNLTLKTLNKAKIALDGFMLLHEDEIPSIKFQEASINRIPKEIQSGVNNAAVFKYDDIDEYYGILWNDSLAYRIILFDDKPDTALAHLDLLMKKDHQSRYKSKIRRNNRGYFDTIFSAPINVPPIKQMNQYA